ncbi:RHS repeat-associated core domain-containing protein [Maridesulfovibrio ferrireducens]|uniref:RHS repeat-associated core domain-containing protein n=1 Tax=Maridesulfovibrio ferrireducens TaxID=246191 RepID=UPI001A27A8A2|nr:RHS repeat-associated core domain-containing protein [Maridesulfovibrio ferrireducens]MBI9112993.1 hypothetical protein [Maridesulfovibrio ferrireducens]
MDVLNLRNEYALTIGRFITPDPIGLAGGDVDVYGYCLDDPINFHDRTRLFIPPILTKISPQHLNPILSYDMTDLI